MIISLRLHFPRKPAAPDVPPQAQLEKVSGVKVKSNKSQHENNALSLQPIV